MGTTPEPGNTKQDWAGTVADRGKWGHKAVQLTRAATEAIVEAAQVKPGMRVLDIASGAGDPALTLASVLGAGGHVTATDLAAEMLEQAQAEARDNGFTNISFHQIAAESLPFPDETFDAVTCPFVLMLFPNPAHALHEIYRVIKPLGRVGFVVFGPPDQNPHAWIAREILGKYVQSRPPAPEAPGQFRFAPAGTISEALRDAGFVQVQEETRLVPWVWPGPPEEYWESNRERSPLVGRLFRKLTPDQREKVNAEVLAAIRQHYDSEQVNFTACIVVAAGVR